MSTQRGYARRRMSLSQRRHLHLTCKPAMSSFWLVSYGGRAWSPWWAYMRYLLDPGGEIFSVRRHHPDTDDDDSPCEAVIVSFGRPHIPNPSTLVRHHEFATWYTGEGVDGLGGTSYWRPLCGWHRNDTVYARLAWIV